ncbi:hypothetical protein Tco_0085966 [Tanacetum coccineum]
MVVERSSGGGAVERCCIRMAVNDLRGGVVYDWIVYEVSSDNFYLFFKGLPGVVFVLLDSYVDAENQDYGGMDVVKTKIMEVWRPDLVQAVCYCARYQARPTQKHLKEVKRIFKYLKGTINMRLWYPKDFGFELTAFSDADHAGCLDTWKSTSEGIQFLGDKLVSWMSKKQNCTAMSSAEAETEYQLADMFTKALPEDRFKYLVRRIGMRCLTPAELETKIELTLEQSQQGVSNDVLDDSVRKRLSFAEVAVRYAVEPQPLPSAKPQTMPSAQTKPMFYCRKKTCERQKKQKKTTSPSLGRTLKINEMLRKKNAEIEAKRIAEEEEAAKDKKEEEETEDDENVEKEVEKNVVVVCSSNFIVCSSWSAPNAPSKTPSTKDTSSSSIDYIPKSPTSSTSLSPNGYLDPPTYPPPRVSPPTPTQENASMNITLTLSPITPLVVQFDTPSPSPPIIGHPIP